MFSNSNKNKGFTLIELISVIIIVAIISIVGIVSYRGYVRRSVATEGKALLAAINAAQQVYYNRTGAFHSSINTKESKNASLGVDFRKNKYFTSYTITTSGENFSAYTEYEGKKLTLISSSTKKPEIIDTYSNQAD